MRSDLKIFLTFVTCDLETVREISYRSEGPYLKSYSFTSNSSKVRQTKELGD